MWQLDSIADAGFVWLWLIHWGRVTHITSELTIIGSDNGLSPRCQAIIWTNAGILLIGPLGTNFNEILIEIHTFSFKKMHLKMSSGKRRPFCLGLNVLTNYRLVYICICVLYEFYTMRWSDKKGAEILDSLKATNSFLEGKLLRFKFHWSALF